MKNKNNLEETLKEKVSGLLEKTMAKSWGISIPKVESDITDKLKNPQLNIYIDTASTFQEAKHKFKVEFLKNELRLHKGNVSQLARMMGLDRRSIHRVMKDSGIKREALQQDRSEEDYTETIIDQTIRSTLDEYKEIIQPQKMEKMYEEVPELSRNIAKRLPHQHLTWKLAGTEFEKQFLAEALKENSWKISQTAKQIALRPETLHRKVTKLGLRKQ